MIKKLSLHHQKYIETATSKFYYMKRFLTLVFVLSSLVAFAQPANDSCFNAINVTLAADGSGTFSGNNTNATASNPGTFSDNCLTSLAPVNDIWFKFTTGTGPNYPQPFKVSVTVDAASAGSPAFDIVRGLCNAMTQVFFSTGCVNGSPAAGNTYDLITTPLDASTTYWVRVASYGGNITIPAGGGTINPYCAPIVLDNTTTGLSTTKCSCGLTDSGGPGGDYGALEDYSYTINPADPHTCIDLFFSNYAFEPSPSLDKLEIYFGSVVDPDSLFSQICDQGTNTSLSVPTYGAITLRFRSDGTVQNAGFEMEWSCSSACPPPLPVSNCTDTTLIPSLPYNRTGMTTCGAGSSFDATDACGSQYMEGEDFVFTYVSPGDECINVRLTGTASSSAVFVMDGCPVADATKCLASAEEPGGNPEILTVQLVDPGTYYIVVSSQAGDCGSSCTSFDILVQNSPCPLKVDDNVSADSLVKTIAAQGVLVDSAVLHCPQSAYGVFSGGVSDGTNFLDGGIVLSNGRANEIEGPNKGTLFASTILGSVGDPTLTAIANTLNGPGITSTFDACILEFDVYAPNDKLIFDYMFMSEEYEEQVGVGVNHDLFAFLVKGPGILDGNTELNLAYVPGTTTPITISTVNANTNAAFYKRNDVLGDLNYNVLEHDGHTTILKAEADVIPCNWYHVRLAIADVNDAAVDAGVLIGANSLFSNAATISSASGNTTGTIVNAAEGCQDGSFTIDLLVPPPAGQSTVIVLNTSTENGQATEGIDYGFIPDSIEFFNNQVIAYFPNGSTQIVPGGGTSYTIDIIPTVDGIQEPSEPVTLFLLSGCATPEPYDSAVVIIRDELVTNLPSTLLMCGDTEQMPLTGSGLDFVDWDNGNLLSDSTIIDPIILTQVDRTFTVIVGNGVCPNDTLSIDVTPYIVTTYGDTTICVGQTAEITSNSNIPGFTYSWDRTDGLSCGDCPSPTFTAADAPIGSTDYVVTFTSADGLCTEVNTVTMVVLEVPNPDIGTDQTICEGANVSLGTTDEGISYSWTDGAGNLLGNNNFINPTPTTTTTYTLLADNGQCTSTDEATINVGGNFTIASNNDETIDLGLSVTVNTTATQTGTNPIGTLTYSWSTTEGLSCTDCPNPVATPSVTTTYTVTATSASGCSESATFTINVVPPQFGVPNVFTPNADATNSTFNFISSTSTYEIVKFNVFDRWGKIVFNTTTPGQGWDGQYNGQDMPQDTYIFSIIIRTPDGTLIEENGEVLLVR
jgi:gliding motility-associated-like protein